MGKGLAWLPGDRVAMAGKQSTLLNGLYLGARNPSRAWGRRRSLTTRIIFR